MKHPHFCDCDSCLNLGGGVRYDGAGVSRTVSALPVAFALEHELAQRRAYARKRRLARALDV